MDTYGGWGAHGGGSLSGKDGSKIDRCGSYAARWVAKSLVKAGLCRRALVQVGLILVQLTYNVIYTRLSGVERLIAASFTASDSMNTLFMIINP